MGAVLREEILLYLVSVCVDSLTVCVCVSVCVYTFFSVYKDALCPLHQ